jgi:alanine racemase
VTDRRPTRVEVDLDAVAANTALLAERAGSARLCAVVKADGYGHGAVPVARTALAHGADWLAVALVEEAAVLRAAGIDAPVLLLSEPPVGSTAEVVDLDLRPTLYSEAGIDAFASAAGHSVHLNVDTGMNRVGARPEEAVALAGRIIGSGLDLEGVWTHCAVADDPDDPFTAHQVERFGAVLAELSAAGIEPEMTHLANSAATLAHPDTRADLVRVGIALYGVAPSPALAHAAPLRPVMTVRSEVCFVKRVSAGERISYGLTHRFDRDTNVATIPIGYADGVPRRLSSTGGEVLVGGARRRIVGVVTMDQLMVDCGDDPVVTGDEAVLLGTQGGERIAPEEWADRLGTIGYEIVCGIGPRVPRAHRGGA